MFTAKALLGQIGRVNRLLPIALLVSLPCVVVAVLFLPDAPMDQIAAFVMAPLLVLFLIARLVLVAADRAESQPDETHPPVPEERDLVVVGFVATGLLALGVVFLVCFLLLLVTCLSYGVYLAIDLGWAADLALRAMKILAIISAGSATLFTLIIIFLKWCRQVAHFVNTRADAISARLPSAHA